MICANCGTENRAGRRFCANCGNALAVVCANCGTENEPSDRFCGNCGRALGEATAATAATATPTPPQNQATAERRLVTVLFADLVGFTPFAEDRDAEDVRATLEGYNRIARDVIGRFGGTVEKFIGDAVMAVWGTPTAHEDDAERAVRAALELVDSVSGLGPGIQARAGVLTGEAAVDLSATDQNLLAGDLVNTAARLQSVAPPGAVLVGQSTQQATSTSIAYEPATERALKGKSAPVAASRALRVTGQRGGVGRSEAVETPFVGRDIDFRRLREALPLRGREPRVALVSVTGPAGIGKSRLAWELEKYIDGVAEAIYWHRGRCPAYGDGVSFWALGEMVRRRAGLAEADDEPTTRAAIAAAVGQYVADETEREWIEHALLSLLGVEATDQPATLFAAWRRFFENVAMHGPTVLVFEDLHWADTGLLDFIDHVLDWSRNLPLLIVTLARPELFDKRPDWGAARRSLTALALDPLSDADMTAMLSAVAPDLESAAVSGIVERADGIPLYAVEFLRMLVADGRLTETDGQYRATGPLGDLAVPQSLRSLITARLDVLPPDDKRLLQEASVLGQSFSQAGLAGVSGSDPAALEAKLRGLVRRELLTFEADPRAPDRGQYAFTQGLICEVAYSTLARAERRDRHVAAARWLESVGGEELAPMLAGHYVAAHDASADGPEKVAVAAQARIALRGAAERATALGGNKQAAALLAQALEVTREPAERARLLEQRAVALYHASRYDEADPVIHEAVQAYRTAGDVAGRVHAQTWFGPILIHLGRIERAGQELEAALAELPADADPAARAELLAKLARVEYRLEHNQRAAELADQALEIAEHHRLVRIVADAMTSKGTAVGALGRPFEGLTLLQAGYEMALRLGDTDTALRAANNVGGYVFNELGVKKAASLAREGLELARSVGDMGQMAWHMKNVMVGTMFGAEPVEPVLTEADVLLGMDFSRTDRRELVIGSLMLGSMAGRDTDALAAEAERLFDDPDDPSAHDDYIFWSMFRPLSMGNFALAAKNGAAAAEADYNYGAMGMSAVFAGLAGDVDECRRLISRYPDIPVAGLFDEIMRSAGVGVLALFDAKRDEGHVLLKEALRQMRDLGDLLDTGFIALAMLKLLGPDEPGARAAAEASITDFERMGAPPMVKLLRDAMGKTAATPTPARRPVEEADAVEV